MEWCAPAAATSACFSGDEDVAITEGGQRGRGGVKQQERAAGTKAVTCGARGPARLQNQAAGAARCRVHQHHVPRSDLINAPGENYCSEALQ